MWLVLFVISTRLKAIAVDAIIRSTSSSLVPFLSRSALSMPKTDSAGSLKGIKLILSERVLMAARFASVLCDL